MVVYNHATTMAQLDTLFENAIAELEFSEIMNEAADKKSSDDKNDEYFTVKSASNSGSIAKVLNIIRALIRAVSTAITNLLVNFDNDDTIYKYENESDGRKTLKLAVDYGFCKTVCSEAVRRIGTAVTKRGKLVGQEFRSDDSDLDDLVTSVKTTVSSRGTLKGTEISKILQTIQNALTQLSKIYRDDLNTSANSLKNSKLIIGCFNSAVIQLNNIKKQGNIDDINKEKAKKDDDIQKVNGSANGSPISNKGDFDKIVTDIKYAFDKFISSMYSQGGNHKDKAKQIILNDANAKYNESYKGLKDFLAQAKNIDVINYRNAPTQKIATFEKNISIIEKLVDDSNKGLDKPLTEAVITNRAVLAMVICRLHGVKVDKKLYLPEFIDPDSLKDADKVFKSSFSDVIGNIFNAISDLVSSTINDGKNAEKGIDERSKKKPANKK